MRDRFAELGPGSNGRTRGTGLQILIHRGELRRRRRRLAFLIALLITSGAALGARHCRTWQPITAAERAKLRRDVIAGCRIHNCTPDKLAALLNQVDRFPPAEEVNGK